MHFLLESKAVAVIGYPHSWRAIDERDRAVDAMHLVDFVEDRLVSSCVSRIEPRVGQIARFRFDRSVQPGVLVSELVDSSTST